MSNIKNYNALQDSVIWSKDGTNNIQLNNDPTSSSIQLNRDLNTVPVATTLNPTGVSNGGFTTNWDRIARVQQAFSSVELPDNATELKVNNSIYVNSATESNVIFDKNVNTITQYFTTPPDNQFNTRLSKLTDKNLELAVLNNNIGIKKNITPPTINDLTANRNIITDALSITTTQASNSHFSVFQNNQKMIYGDNATTKIINIQNFSDALFYTVNISTLGITLSSDVNSVFANSVIYMVKPDNYISQTNAVFTIFLTNATNTILFMIKCNGDPTLSASYTASSSYLNVGGSVNPILTSTANGASASFVAINPTISVGFAPLNINFYDNVNNLYIHQSVNSTKTSFNYLITNFDMTQACYYPNYNLTSLANTVTYNVSCNYNSCCSCNIFSLNSVSTQYCQIVYWDKTTQSLSQSQLILLNSTIANLYNRLSNSNLDMGSYIENNIIYFYMPIFIENTVDVNYDIRLLCLKEEIVNMISTAPTIEFNRVINTNVSTTRTSLNQKPYSIRVYDYNKIEVYSSMSSVMRTSNDAFQTFVAYSYSAFPNLNNVNICIWCETRQATIIAGQSSKLFHDVLHILLFSVSPSSVYTRCNYLYLTAPTPTQTSLGNIKFNSNDIELEASNDLILTTNAVNGTISLNGGNIVSATAGANSGQHLRLILNGVAYKINLYNDV